MFAETEAMRARLRNPSGKGKTKKGVAAKRKEKKPMAQRRKKPAKKAAKKSTRATKRTRRPAKVTRGTGRTSRVKVRGKAVSRSVSTTIKNAKRKSVTYRRHKGGGASIILRAGNPANSAQTIGVFVVGGVAGMATSTLLDRWLATRASSQTGDKVLYGASAATAITAKSDGLRIFAQVAVGGVSAVGAYASRKKMPLLAMGLAGFAGAYLVKAGFMVISDHVLPMLFKSKKAGDAGDRYFPDRQPTASGGTDGLRGLRGHRMTGGAPLPFGSKPARLGPMAAGSVGGNPGCRRQPLVGPQPADQDTCSCNPFPQSDEIACLRKVSGQSTTNGCAKVTPQPGIEDRRKVPGLRVPREPGEGYDPGAHVYDRAPLPEVSLQEKPPVTLPGLPSTREPSASPTPSYQLNPSRTLQQSPYVDKNLSFKPIEMPR